MKRPPFKYIASTPKLITPAISDFCCQLSSESPVYLQAKPQPNAQVGMCYDNVDLIDGEPVFGWLIWELPGVYLTAEHHAVVRIEGLLVDVTPPFAGEKRVLFQPDSTTPHVPLRPVNKYHALSTDTRIQSFIALAERNAWLHRDGAFGGIEYRLNDAKACRLLDSYLSRNRPSSDEKRRKRKDERKRKKANR